MELEELFKTQIPLEIQKLLKFLKTDHKIQQKSKNQSRIK